MTKLCSIPYSAAAAAAAADYLNRTHMYVCIMEHGGSDDSVCNQMQQCRVQIAAYN